MISDHDAEVVVVGLDRTFTYDKLAIATRLLRGGAVLVGTNPDIVLPTPDGFEPSGGVLVEAVASAGGVRPIIVGKPETPMLETALERLGTAREHTAMIGDQLATDILAGQRAGLMTLLVTTGVSTDGVPAGITPQFTVDDLRDVGF